MIIEIKKDGHTDVWEWKQVEATGLWKDGGIAIVYEATMTNGLSVGWKKKFPIRNNINGVPSVSMELCADLFVQTEYGQHYTKSTSYYVP